MSRSVTDERGQAVPLFLVLVLLAVVGLLGLAHLGTTVDDAARARTAADAAALAGAADGLDAATALAAANGGQLTGFDRHDGVVEVAVRVGDVVAVARAEASVQWLGSPSLPTSSPTARS